MAKQTELSEIRGQHRHEHELGGARGDVAAGLGQHGGSRAAGGKAGRIDVRAAGRELRRRFRFKGDWDERAEMVLRYLTASF